MKIGQRQKQGQRVGLMLTRKLEVNQDPNNVQKNKIIYNIILAII